VSIARDFVVGLGIAVLLAAVVSIPVGAYLRYRVSRMNGKESSLKQTWWISFVGLLLASVLQAVLNLLGPLFSLLGAVASVWLFFGILKDNLVKVLQGDTAGARRLATAVTVFVVLTMLVIGAALWTLTSPQAIRQH
jgi:hypothetical protein